MSNLVVESTLNAISVRKYGTDEIVATIPTGDAVEVLEDMIQTLTEDDKARLFHKVGQKATLFDITAFRAGASAAAVNTRGGVHAYF